MVRPMAEVEGLKMLLKAVSRDEIGLTRETELECDQVKDERVPGNEQSKEV